MWFLEGVVGVGKGSAAFAAEQAASGPAVKGAGGREEG